jgi:ribosomal protein S18 acetylase RimI-like enzyme
MTIEIRALQPDDFAAVDALWSFMKGVVLREDDTLESFSRFLERNPDCCYGAGHGRDVLVGAIMAGHDGRRGYLYHLAVKPRFRRQGIGRQMVDKSLSAMQAQGINKFHAYVKRRNVTASLFWKNMGWNLRSDICIYSSLNI